MIMTPNLIHWAKAGLTALIIAAAIIVSISYSLPNIYWQGWFL